jgi:hypothetical protein
LSFQTTNTRITDIVSTNRSTVYLAPRGKNNFSSLNSTFFFAEPKTTTTTTTTTTPAPITVEPTILVPEIVNHTRIIDIIVTNSTRVLRFGEL